MRPLLSYRLVDRAIFGHSGIDIRNRLALDKEFGKRFPEQSSEQRREAFLRALPLSFGNRFPRVGVGATAASIFLFVLLSPKGFVRAVFGVHSLFGGSASALNYGVLGLQWLAFYGIMSLAGAAVAGIFALVWYAVRIARF